MGQEIPSSRFGLADFEHFGQLLEQETRLLERWFAEDRFSRAPWTGGFELEAWLVDDQARPLPVNEPFLARLGDPLVVPELARFNIEINNPPRPLTGDALRVMQAGLDATWARCRAVAAEFDARLLIIGIPPSLQEQDLGLARMSDSARYRALNEQVLLLRGGEPLRLEIEGNERLQAEHGDVMLESATTSFQIHLQVPPAEAVRAYNTALLISGPMVAATSNAPFLFGHQLWEETRIPVFEQAVASAPGAPPRVTFTRDYARHSLLECFRENLHDYPVLLPIDLGEPPERLAHLRLHNGTIWRWNRPLLGFDADGTPHLRIEHRVVPSGPTLTDCIANAALFFGLVRAFCQAGEDPQSLLPFAVARENFYAAARFGLQAGFVWFGGITVGAEELLLGSLLPRAHQGLESLGISAPDREYFLGIIEQRLRGGRTGSTWQRQWVQAHGNDPVALTRAYLQQQDRGRPVHQWELERRT